MNQAFNSGKIELIEQNYHKILLQSNSSILKLRAMISVANLKDELNLIDPKVKEKLFVEFDEGANWMTRPDLLRLFTDTMPLWDSSDLSFFLSAGYLRKYKRSIIYLNYYKKDIFASSRII